MAQIPPLNSCCYVNNGGAPASCPPKCQQAGPSQPDTPALATPWERGSGMEPLLPNPTLLPLTWLSLALLGPRPSAEWEMRCTPDHALDDCSCRSQDVFISLPCLVTIMKTVALQLVLHQGKRDIYPTNVFFVTLSLLVSLSFLPFLRSAHHYSTIHPPAAEGGSWQEKTLPWEAL